MVKITFLDNNTFLVNNNGGKEYFNQYINIITNKLLYCAKPYLKDNGGWIFHYNKLDEVKQCFNNNIIYTNKYTPPLYSDMGKDMKLQPYDYQKEAIYSAINNKEELLVLPCGAGTFLGI